MAGHGEGAPLGSRRANKEIAGAPHISRQTVTKHAVNIYQKLQATDPGEAIGRARAPGLFTPAFATG